MSIRHSHIQAGYDEAVVFAELLGFTCSICAPATWPVGRVIRFAEEKFPKPNSPFSSDGDRWTSIDKSTLGMGSATPNPCNQYPDRMHYFMMRGET